VRRRYRYNSETKEMEEVGQESRAQSPLVMGDIEPFVSPIDGAIISSRPHLREHMRKHGVTHSSDFDSPGGFWDKKRQARADYLAGKTNPDSKQRRQQLAESFEILRNKSRYSSG